MPTELEPGVLYVAEEFGAAAHLCPCGCRTIVRTPLDQTEWSLEETDEGPTLDPSVGNWQDPCQSHYWIERGRVVWAPKWSSRQVEAGRRREQSRRDDYYKSLQRKNESKTRSLWNRLKTILGK